MTIFLMIQGRRRKERTFVQGSRLPTTGARHRHVEDDFTF